MIDQAIVPFDLVLNVNRKIDVLNIGNEKNTVVVVDDVFENPQLLNEFAVSGSEFSKKDANFYPGLKKGLPAFYGELVLEALEQIVRESFNVPTAQLLIARSDLSLASFPQKQLHPLQCIPHFDTNTVKQFATLVYLSDPKLGGTGFYRHRSTGFEAVTEDRVSEYGNLLKQEGRVRGNVQQRYINGDSPLFERIASVEARYNRLVLYRSCLLHSGNIEQPESLTDDPRTGRLTSNAFICY